MALIKCKECGHEVSDKASACPNCGCPMGPMENVGATQEEVIHEEPKKKKGWILALIVALLCLIGGGGYYAYSKLLRGGDDKNAIVEITPEFIKALEAYDELTSFSEGYAAVKKGEKWGYIDTKGQEVVQCQYTEAYSFHEGLAAVQKNGKWGYIDTQGKEVVPINMEAIQAGRFSEGFAFILIDYDESFIVIDKTGKKMFGGKCGNYFGFMGSGVTSDFESFIPHYKNGKLYVVDSDYNYDVYDYSGKILERGVSDFLSENASNDSTQYEVIEEELKVGEGEDDVFYLYGLKDHRGNVLVAPEYDRVDDEGVSNGVVLVVLTEEGNDVIRGKADDVTSWDANVHYGYADFKGNDTFSEELKRRCRESKGLAAEKLLEMEEEERRASEHPDWLQGRWIGTDNGSGYPVEVIIDGDNLIQKINGQICYNGSYQFNGDFIVYNDGNDFWPVDNDRQVLTYDDLPMRKESGNSSISSTSSNSPSWIQGTWTYDMNSPVGTIASYKIVIEGNTMSFYRNGKQMWSEQFTYKNGKLIGGSHELRTNEDSHRIIDENGNRYNGRGSSSPFQFKTGHDVIGYLSGKTYRRDGNSLQIRQDGCYINGQCVSGAPVVTNYSSYSAAVRANLIPSGTITFYINSKDGTMTNSLGESWH